MGGGISKGEMERILAEEWCKTEKVFAKYQREAQEKERQAQQDREAAAAALALTDEAMKMLETQQKRAEEEARRAAAALAAATAENRQSAEAAARRAEAELEKEREAAATAAKHAASERAAISLKLQQEQVLRAEQARTQKKELEAARADADRRVVEEIAKEHEKRFQRWKALNRDYPVPDHLKGYVNAVSEEFNAAEGQAKRFVNIGLLGNSGIGKSSLITCILEKFESASSNYVRPLTSFQGDGTREPTPYLLGEPCNEHEVYIWDLPGQGTKQFPASTYLCDMGLKYFDAILVLTEKRWTENDATLLSAIRFAGIWCCVVRTKMDQAVEEAQHDLKLSQEDAIQEVRRKLIEDLGDLEEEKVHLVTSRKQKWIGGENGASGYGSIEMLCNQIRMMLQGGPYSTIPSPQHDEAMDRARFSDGNLSSSWEIMITE